MPNPPEPGQRKKKPVSSPASPAPQPAVPVEVPSGIPAWIPEKLLKNRPLLGGVIGGGVLLLVIAGWALFSGSGGQTTGSEDNDATEEATSEDEPSQASADKSGKTKGKAGGGAFHGVPLLPPEFKTVNCRIYTPEPGFFVLVDGEVARKKTGDQLMTPCEVAITPGNHTLTVIKKGFKDSSNEVLIDDGRDFDFEAAFEPFAEGTGYFASRFPKAEVGEELSLFSLNTEGKVLDPFVQPDGLSIWFGGDREGVKGVYVARRACVLDEFGAPEMLAGTRGTHVPTSPTTTADELLVAYTVTDEARIWGVARESNQVPFGERKLLSYSDREGEVWRSAQVSGDAKRLYSAQERKEKIGPYVTSRKALDQKFGKKWSAARMPGEHPCMSPDCLRQYVFDGSKLSRASRRKISDEFSQLDVIAELSLKSYVHRPAHRQYFVSNDEQWLYYTDDPVGGGNLYVVRISDGPGWGFIARGKSIPQKEATVVADDSAEMKPDEAAEKPVSKNEPPADPRTRPLPYADLRAKLEGLLTKADMSAATKLIEAARADPQFAQDAEPLKWDADDVALVQGFWKDVEQVLGKMKPGDPIRIGPLQMAFKSFSEGKLTADASGKLVTKAIREMTASDLVAIADRGIDRTSEPAQLQVVAFLSCDPKVSPKTFSGRLQRAGSGGKAFLEHQTERKLHVIQREFDRENIGPGLKMIDQLIAAAPKSETAVKAAALRDKLFTRLEWRPVGDQKWNLSTPGEYIAEGARAENSFLVSPGEYANFQLSLEWKTTGETAQGGVYFRYKNGETLRGNAFKIHLANDYDIRDRPDRFSTGALLGVRGPKTNAVKKAGEWNTLDIRAEGERVRVAVNGVEVLDTPLNDPNIGKAGYVCIDGVFPGIAYRKILVYELPPSGGAKAP